MVTAEAAIQLVAVRDSIVCRLLSADHAEMGRRMFAGEDFDSQRPEPIYKEFKSVVPEAGLSAFGGGQRLPEVIDD